MRNKKKVVKVIGIFKNILWISKTATVRFCKSVSCIWLMLCHFSNARETLSQNLSETVSLCMLRELGPISPSYIWRIQCVKVARFRPTWLQPSIPCPPQPHRKLLPTWGHQCMLVRGPLLRPLTQAVELCTTASTGKTIF